MHNIYIYRIIFNGTSCIFILHFFNRPTLKCFLIVHNKKRVRNLIILFIFQEIMSKINGKLTCKLVPLETKVLACYDCWVTKILFVALPIDLVLERGQLQRIFIALRQAVGSLTKDIIRWPAAAEAELIACSFEIRPKKPPANSRENYINRKGVPAKQLQAVCDHHMLT